VFLQDGDEARRVLAEFGGVLLGLMPLKKPA
jgi:hypothetical protein